MELLATSGRPPIPCRHPAFPSSAPASALHLHSSSRPNPKSYSSVPLSHKSSLGLGRSARRPLRANATDEDTNTAVAGDASRRKGVEGQSFMMGPFSAEENDPADDAWSKLNLKLESGDATTILIYGAGALVALWVSAAIVSSIDSLPVFPKIMEVVGLGYTVWFASRYLVFKENREELFRNIDDLKEKILGRDN